MRIFRIATSQASTARVSAPGSGSASILAIARRRKLYAHDCEDTLIERKPPHRVTVNRIVCDHSWAGRPDQVRTEYQIGTCLFLASEDLARRNTLSQRGELRVSDNSGVGLL